MKNLFRYISFAVSIAVSVCVVSCEIDKTTTIPSKDTVYFPIGNNIEIHPLGDTLNLSFTSDVDWYIEVNPSAPTWLDISLGESRSHTNKKGTTQFNIAAKIHKGVKGKAANKAEIKFYSSTGEELHSTEIVQPAAYINIEQMTGSQGSFEWYAEGTEKSRSYTVSSNIHWECKVANDTIFSSDISNGGSLKGETKNLVIQARDINLGQEPLATALVFSAVKKNGNQSFLMDEEFATLPLQQNNLVFNAPSEFPHIGELGSYKFSSQTDYNDPDVVEIEVMTETDYHILWRTEQEATFKALGTNDQWFVLSDSRGMGNVLRRDKLTVEVTDANPDTVARVAVVRLESDLNERAFRDIKLIQDPYTWDISIDELPADEVGSTEIQIRTKGPWTIQVPANEGWWETDETVWSGEGDKVITINSTMWNLDPKNDLSADFVISNGCNELVTSLPLVKDHFHFSIGENLVNDREMAKTVLAELRKKDATRYPFEIDCSGPWSCKFVDKADLDSTWVRIEKESDTLMRLGAWNNNTEDKDRNAKLIFTSHIHSQFGQTLTETISLTQLRHVFGWEPDEWTSDVRDKNCNQPAYIDNGNDATFGFSTTFSDEWSLTSDQDWVKFHLNGKNPSQTISGDGESTDEKYIYVTVDNNYATNRSRKATVKVRDLYMETEKTFVISQEAFVFDVNCQSSYNVGPFDANLKEFDLCITKNAPWTVTVTGDAGLLKEYTSSGTGTGSYTSFAFATNAVTDINTSDRKATVSINVDGDKLVKTFTVQQSGYKFKNSTTPQDFHEVEFATQKIKIDCYQDDWAVKSAPTDWLTAVKNGQYLELKPIAVNSNIGQANTGSVVISTPFGGNEKTISLNVKQNGYKFDVSQSVLEFEPLDDRSVKKSITINASAGWKFDMMADFSVEKKNNSTIEVYVDKCYYETSGDKTNLLNLTSDHGHKQTVTLKQKPYIFSVSSFKDTTVDNKEQTITFDNLKCTGKLTANVEVGKTWLTIGTEPTNGSLVLKVAANTGKDAAKRTVKVVLSSEHAAFNAGLSKEIVITQEK